MDDGWSVNLKFLDNVFKDRVDNELHQVVNIGSCGIHTVHGAFKTGAEERLASSTLQGECRTDRLLIA